MSRPSQPGPLPYSPNPFHAGPGQIPPGQGAAPRRARDHASTFVEDLEQLAEELGLGTDLILSRAVSLYRKLARLARPFDLTPMGYVKKLLMDATPGRGSRRRERDERGDRDYGDEERSRRHEVSDRLPLSWVSMRPELEAEQHRRRRKRKRRDQARGRELEALRDEVRRLRWLTLTGDAEAAADLPPEALGDFFAPPSASRVARQSEAPAARPSRSTPAQPTAARREPLSPAQLFRRLREAEGAMTEGVQQTPAAAQPQVTAPNRIPVHGRPAPARGRPLEAAMAAFGLSQAASAAPGAPMGVHVANAGPHSVPGAGWGAPIYPAGYAPAAPGHLPGGGYGGG
ncbi:MAG: hypothetical protein ACYTFT_13025, partial [Planctomycetota bacterium]